jgi:hypothetical protein
MSFWDMSDGSTAKATEEYETQGGGGVIPDNTDVLSFIDEIKWDEKDGNKYISIRWRVAKPEALKNRVIFQNLWVLGNDPNAKDAEKRKKKGDNAKRMLAAIDTNAGGGLLAINGIPTDEQLQSCLMNKMMVVKVKVYEMTDNMTGGKIEGNWIAAVSPKTKAISEGVTAKPSSPRPEPDRVANGTARYDDSEIPF